MNFPRSIVWPRRFNIDWKMLVFTALWLPAAFAKDLISTCHAPPVWRGETGTVTCFFPVTLASVPPVTATMEHYPPNSSTPDYVYEIVITEKGAKPYVNRPTDGYNLTSDVDVLGKEISVQIPLVSEEHLGRYVCQVMSDSLQGKVHPEPCTLIFKNETDAAPTTPPENSAERDTAPTVIIVVVVVIVAIASTGLLVFLFRRGHLPCKKGQSPGPKSAEEGEHMETSFSPSAQSGCLPCKKGKRLGLKLAEEGEPMQTLSGTPVQSGHRVQDVNSSLTAVIRNGIVEERKKQLDECARGKR